MVVYSLANQKGGVGKTTTTIQLAHVDASNGERVLIIDLDSQKSASKNLGMEAAVGKHTVYALLTEPSEGIAHIVTTYHGTKTCPVVYPKGGCIDLIPGAKQVTDAPAVFDRTRDRQPVPSFEHVLPYIIKMFCAGYTKIYLDPGPSQDRVSAASIYAADRVISPVAAEPMALDGVQELLVNLRESNVARAGLHLPGQTKLAGLLISKVYPDQMEVVQQLQQVLDASGIGHFGAVYIPYTTAGWKSPADRVPIAVYAPDDPAAAAYRTIAASLQ